jgi:hypothetical protein
VTGVTARRNVCEFWKGIVGTPGRASTARSGIRRPAGKGKVETDFSGAGRLYQGPSRGRQTSIASGRVRGHGTGAEAGVPRVVRQVLDPHQWLVTFHLQRTRFEVMVERKLWRPSLRMTAMSRSPNATCASEPRQPNSAISSINQRQSTSDHAGQAERLRCHVQCHSLYAS